MEGLHFQTKPGNDGYSVAISRGTAYEAYLDRVQWQDFSDKVLRGAMKATLSADTVVQANRKTDAQGVKTLGRYEH
ncbi:hypothetical protein DIPPA_21205 [Diplonema papillatum]|nr:hypothetical protein DIPPA_21205 [Diplonema papillatum]